MLLRQISVAFLVAAAGMAQTDPAVQRESRELLSELIAINTTDSAAGDNTAAAQAVAKRLVAAGYPANDVQVLVPPGRPTKGNLVARLRSAGSGQKPILFMGHLDVVEARRMTGRRIRSNWWRRTGIFTPAGRRT
ncbi:MAG TPA: hypothetical protein VNH18_35395 [Bryobacteraceae bacterium]|nr:hypothetical protein [Bryobacteraceae bacterium]